jgi:hypothetical protein
MNKSDRPQYELAEEVYFLAYPGTDDKHFKKEKVREIFEWIHNGEICLSCNAEDRKSVV